MSYTTIDHTVRRELDLTLNEYAICDSIYYLSRGGFCTASKEYLGEFIGISRQSVQTILKKLKDKHLIEQGKQGLRTTATWDHAVQKMHTDCKESLHEGVKKVDTNCKESLHEGVKKVDTNCKESLHNNNSIDTTIKDMAFYNAVNKYFYENSKVYRPCKKEGNHIHQLEKKLKTYDAFFVIAEFYKQLTLSENATRKWWRDQPFIPSALNTLLPRIQTIMQAPAPHKQTMKELYG